MFNQILSFLKHNIFKMILIIPYIFIILGFIIINLYLKQYYIADNTIFNYKLFISGVIFSLYIFGIFLVYFIDIDELKRKNIFIIIMFILIRTIIIFNLTVFVFIDSIQLSEGIIFNHLVGVDNQKTSFINFMFSIFPLLIIRIILNKIYRNTVFIRVIMIISYIMQLAAALVILLPNNELKSLFYIPVICSSSVIGSFIFLLIIHREKKEKLSSSSVLSPPSKAKLSMVLILMVVFMFSFIINNYVKVLMPLIPGELGGGKKEMITLSVGDKTFTGALIFHNEDNFYIETDNDEIVKIDTTTNQFVSYSLEP